MTLYKTITFFLICCFGLNAQNEKMPDDFVYLDVEIPDIIYELRYYGSNNFVGKPIRGYESNRTVLTRDAAAALAKVQKELIQQDLMLKVFDAYRPQTAVDHFIEWARDKNDTLMKQYFYPNVAKKDLFRLGYIASQSGHSRGSTIDLTLIDVENCKELDMGSGYDFFGKISHQNFRGISLEQQENRRKLRNIMVKHGFRPYSEEWWHFSYRNEPYPNSYFNFIVE